MLKTTNLHKSYGSKEVLHGLDLEFKPGNITGVVGRNGAGKTTLFRCLADLESYEGKITTNLGTRRAITGFMDTSPYFLEKLTAKEYLLLLCRGRKISLPPEADFNIFNLPLNQYAATYSTGMKKKLALTGVLLQGNEIFIFDEPFSGVDIESNILMKEIFLKLKEKKKVVIVSSHVFEVLEELCDGLYYLHEGRIEQTAFTPREFSAIKEKMGNRGVKANLDKLLNP